MADGLQSSTQAPATSEAETQKMQEALASSFSALINQITAMANKEISS
jgi:hypothetical protein